MSNDELFSLLVAIGFVLTTWVQWIRSGIAIPAYHRPRGARTTLSVTSAVAVALLYFVLQRWASSDVRDSTLYTSYYMVMGAGFTGATLLLLGAMGLSVRDDALERFNPAAGIALGGAILGCTAAFAGANIGDGPGWWVVVFSALLSNGALIAGWLVLDRLAETGEAITLDRDEATGWRAAGWFTGGGIIFGRAAAGNWSGAESAIFDFFRVGGGGLALFLGALAIEFSLRSKHERRSHLFCGIVPAAIYLCGAIAYVIIRHPL